MKTAFAISPDRTRIAYDVAGTGPVLMLLHGGFQTRRVWHDLGYVDRLRARFTVVAVDLRGNGESDKATSAEAYLIDRLCEDLLAVADAVGARRFTIWGFSYGANVGRYLAVRSARSGSSGLPMTRLWKACVGTKAAFREQLSHWWSSPALRMKTSSSRLSRCCLGWRTSLYGGSLLSDSEDRAKPVNLR